MREWIRSSFRHRIFVTVLMVTLLPLLLCDVLMMKAIIGRSEAMLAQDAQTELGLLYKGFDDAVKTADGITASLSDSIVVRSALRRGGSDSRLLYQALYRQTEVMREYAGFYVYGSGGERLYSSGLSYGGTEDLPVNWGALRAAAESEGMCCQAGESSGLLLCRAVRSYSDEILGYILVQIPQEGFTRLFGSCIGSASDIFLLDGTWRQIYCSNSIRADEMAEALRSKLLAGESLDDGERMFYPRRHEGTGVTLLLQQPRIYTARVTGSIYSVCAIMGVLCLLLSLLCAWALSRHLSKPVNELDEAMGRVRQGDYDAELKSDRIDEMGRLTASFNRMTKEYRQNLERSVQRERELNETELSMMQAQLNPHFLYNTLDSLKWLGVTNGIPQVAAVSTDLAVLLRAGISGNRLISLEEEIELLEKYLDIQLLRFEDRFACEIDVDESFQHCIVPKLILQPLLENAIIHGVSEMNDGYIKLSAREENGTLVLSVQDNGAGIPPDILECLNRRDMEMPAGHLGLKNVDRIVRLYYGADYGISAGSEPGKGSYVELRLPMSERSDANA